MRTARTSVLVLSILALVAAGCGTNKSATKTASESKTAATAATAPPVPPPTFPLTGLPTNGAPANRPSLSVKVDNIQDALPQSGLNNADIVTEALVEGGQTRLFVTFHSQDAPVVGPIRSARPVDADLLRALGGGLFAYSGAAPGEIAPVEDHSNATLLSNDVGSPGFYRDRAKRAPHNVFAATGDLYAAGAEAGDHSAAPPAIFHYGPSTGGRPVTDADIPLGEHATAAWHWNAAAGVYERDQNGQQDVLEDGSRVSAADVVMMSVSIAGTGVYDVNGVEDPLPVVIGTGQAWLMRDGLLVEGTWSRPTLESPTVFTDTAGHEMLLHPGRAWVELIQDSLQPSFT